MTPGVHILAKAPIQGLAKTRLAQVLGATGAARLARLQLADTVRITRKARLGRVTLWAAPGCWHPALRALERRNGLRLRAQAPGDLGTRMVYAARRAHRSGESPILIGTDCMDLRPRDLRAAGDALTDGADAVIGPAKDGGYYLLGLRRPLPALFRDMPWSSDQVLHETLQRLRRGGRQYQLLPVRGDLDHPADLMGRSPHMLMRLARPANKK